MFAIGPKKPAPGKGDTEVEIAVTKAPLSGMARKRASKQILAAIDAGDPAALDRALEAHYQACEGGGAEEETEE